MAALLLVLAVICEVIAALLGFSVFSGAHFDGWLATGIALFAASGLVGAWPITLRRPAE